jgi:outer membrane lipoprotein carrier protein
MFRKIFFAMLIPLAVVGQEDEKAAAILKAVSTTNSAYKNISLNFTFTLQNKQAKVNDVRTGQLILAGSKFHLQLMGQDIYSDGKMVWTVMKDAKEVHLKSIEEFREETELDPANFFNQYKNGFKQKYINEEVKDGKTLSIIDLFPEVPGKKPYSRIRMGIDRSTNHLIYSKTFGKDGTDFLLEVKTMKTNVTVAADEFTYVQKKLEDAGYDIVDFR